MALWLAPSQMSSNRTALPGRPWHGMTSAKKAPERAVDTANTTQSTAATRRTPFYKDMSAQVFAGMLLGAAIGHFWPQGAEFMSTLGDLFIRLIAMFVGLIIFCAVVHGVATVREAKSVGRVAIRALIYFEVVTTFALIIGLITINLLAPGKGAHFDLSALPAHALDSYQHTASTISAGGFLLSIVPHTALSAFTEGNVLQVVFLSVLFAFGLLAVGPRGEPMIDMIEITKLTVFKIIGYIMWLAPIGAMGAIAATVGKFGIGSLATLGALVGEFYLTCVLFIVIVLWPIAWWNGINLLSLIRYIRTELLVVFGTSSSESVFPQLVQKLTALGCDESIVGLVLPTGYAFNHDGTCLYFAAVSIFLAQATGIDLSLTQQLGSPRYPAGDVEGRRRRRRICHRRSGVDAGRDRHRSGRRGGPDPRRAPAAVVRLRRRQHSRQCAGDHRHRAMGRRGGQESAGERAVAAGRYGLVGRPIRTLSEIRKTETAYRPSPGALTELFTLPCHYSLFAGQLSPGGLLSAARVLLGVQR